MPFFSSNHTAEPVIIKRLDKMAPLIHQMPELSALNLTQVLNSEVTCRVCRGQRVVCVRSRHNNKLSYTHCLNCLGSGRMRNGDGL